MNIAIVFGGQSTEYEVSCMSAASIIENIKGHNIIKIGVTKEGKWLKTEADPKQIKRCEWQETEGNRPIGVSLYHKKIMCDSEKLEIDVVFNIIHGQQGEDGAFQGLFEILNIKYVGSGVLASALCMDKAMANIILTNAGIAHTPWIVAEKHELNDVAAICRKIEEKLKYPIFVKPSNAGSSVGITKCKNSESLQEALILAAKHDRRIIIEQGVHNAIEIEVAVMGNENPVASCCGKVVPANEFYDYNAKYENEKSETLIPSGLDSYTESQVIDMAIRAYRACDCRGLSRVDFFVTDGGEIYINEINTLPGFTQISMFSKLFMASGRSYAQIIDELIEYALKD